MPKTSNLRVAVLPRQNLKGNTSRSVPAAKAKPDWNIITLGRAPEARPRRKASVPVKRAPDRVRANILDVATEEFAGNGLTGTSMDDIASRTRTSKRMLYYYYGSKEGLYLAVLRDQIARIRTYEAGLDLDKLPPLKALAHLVRKRFDYHIAHPEYARLVMIENIHHGKNIANIAQFVGLHTPAVEMLARICRRGVKAKMMRPGIDPLQLQLTIGALCVFTVANRYTVGKLFGIDMMAAEIADRRREEVVGFVLNHVRTARV